MSKKWFAGFERGPTIAEDVERSGLANLSFILENIKRDQNMLGRLNSKVARYSERHFNDIRRQCICYFVREKTLFEVDTANNHLLMI